MKATVEFVIETAPAFDRLRSPDVTAVLRGFSKPVLKYFFQRLFDTFESGVLDLAERTENGSAGSTGVVRFVWNADCVTSALDAAKRYAGIQQCSPEK